MDDIHEKQAERTKTRLGIAIDSADLRTGLPQRYQRQPTQGWPTN